MIQWTKIEAGEYKSEDGRFGISKTWNRIYSDHWELQDTTIEPYYKGIYIENSLRECKLKAEAIILEEKRESSK